MPVSGCLHRKYAHGENQDQGEQSYGYSLGHLRTLGTPTEHDISDATSAINVSRFMSYQPGRYAKIILVTYTGCAMIVSTAI